MFKKTNRLAKHTAVQAALRAGRGFFNPLFNIRFLNTQNSTSRFTIVVSTKVDKRAVKRNRLKRIIREYIRNAMPGLRLGDYAIMLKPLAAKRSEQELILNLNSALINWGLKK